MNKELTLEKSYLILVEFLMMSKRRVAEIGAKYNLSSMQAITLLSLEEPRPMGDFRHIFNCDASNVTGIIDGLEQKQLVKRYEIDSDRRVKLVQLLTNGKRLRSTLLHELTTDGQYVLADLSDSEAATFIELIKKITVRSKLTTLSTKG